MGYRGVVLAVLALAAGACASVGDNSIDAGERVVLVAPVLAPPRDSNSHATDRSRQFPILVLLAQRNQPQYSRELQAKSLEKNPQPIYVQKLEDQVQESPSTAVVNRQKRHLHKKLFGLGLGGGYGGGYSGGGGGCYDCGGGGYQQPATIVIVKEKSYGGHGGHYGGNQGYGGNHQGYGGGGGGGGGYGGGFGGGYGGGGGGGGGGGYGQQGGGGGCQGGCGGGYNGGGGGGGGGAHAHAEAHATADSYAYGKK